MKIVYSVFVLIMFYGCSSIKTHESYSKSFGVRHTVSIGNELYVLKKQENLRNAFGKADIFGGKVATGYTDLRFSGLTPDGKIIFRITDLDIDSNESTMSRYGSSYSTVNSTSSIYGNTAYTNSTVNHYSKPKSTTTHLPPNTSEFLFDPKDKVLRLGDINIKIINVSSYSLTYMLTK